MSVRTVFREIPEHISTAPGTQVPFLYTLEDSDGNGIIIDDNRNTQSPNPNNHIPYTGKILVENNVSYNNGGAGIEVFYSDNVDVVNNTTYHNGWKVKYPEIDFTNAVNGGSYNNITYAREGIKAFAIDNSNNITSNYNIYFGETMGQLGPNDEREQPEFTNRDGNVFTLKGTSPGVDTCDGPLKATHDITGISRPLGRGHDCGAYERAKEDMAPSAPEELRIIE